MKAIVVAVFAFAAACATTTTQGPGSTQGASDPSAGSDCTEQAITGSTIPRMVCRSPEERDADKKDANDLVSKPRAQPTKGK